MLQEQDLNRSHIGGHPEALESTDDDPNTSQMSAGEASDSWPVGELPEGVYAHLWQIIIEGRRRDGHNWAIKVLEEVEGR
jgi:hypothetical protein